MLNKNQYKIFPLGESALTIEFGTEISAELNGFAVSVAHGIAKAGFPGFIESVPSYASVTVFYDPRQTAIFARPRGNAHTAVRRIVEDACGKAAIGEEEDRPPIGVPVDFSRNAAPDLEFVAKHNGLDPETVIEIFLSRDYRVYMLGFLPGFPYMGEVDPRIAAPRLESPRKKVISGSVGIAGRQTGIYPMDSPGGWRLIGHSDIELFSMEKSTPTLFSPGDMVRFVRVK